jgi:F-type H+-transporting ATPase subunit b
MRMDWWTLGLQTVNVLILIWILGRFFFGPVVDIVAKRQEEANKLLTDAAGACHEATDARNDAEKMRTEIAAERDHLIAQARKSAQIERQNLLAEVSQEIAKLRSEAEAAIASDRSAVEQAIIARASELAVEIAERLLGRLPPETSVATFLDGLCRELRALPSEAKDSFASATPDHVQVVTANLPSSAEMEAIRSGIKEALGSELLLEFRTDPALIAGIELHGRSIIVRNSWRADLDRICEELDGGRRKS